MRDLANTKIGENYIFSGTNTSSPLYPDSTSKVMSTGTGLNKSIEINVFDGIKMQVNIPGEALFKGLDDMMQSVSDTLNNPASTGQEINW